MKKVMLLAVVMLSSLSLFAQRAVGTWTLAPKVGLNIATLTKSGDSDARLALAVGGEAEYQVSDLFSITGGLLYSMQGVEYSDNGYTSTTKLDYLNVPILANVYIAKGLAVKLGIQPAFNLNASQKVEGGGHSSEGDLDGINSVDFAIPIGVSYEFNNIVVDGRYNWGLTKIADGTQSKNSVFQITLGYKFQL